MPTITLRDGRSLTWEEQGDPGGTPVLTLHGSPGSRLTRPPIDDRLQRAGIRQITFDRPGYGGSDPLPGRRVVDVAADTEDLLDALGLDRVAVWGGSGGGPHVLALATALAHRCTVVHCDVGPGPAAEMGHEAFLDGMDPENVRRFRTAMGGREAAAEEFGRDLHRLVDQVRTDPGTLFAEMDLPASDRAILRDLGASIAPGIIESARQGPWGFVDDFIAIGEPWGFDPAGAGAPVIISYGRDDVNVPAAHGDWLAAHVPAIDVRVTTGRGHLATPDERFTTLAALAAYAE